MIHLQSVSFDVIPPASLLAKVCSIHFLMNHVSQGNHSVYDSVSSHQHYVQGYCSENLLCVLASFQLLALCISLLFFLLLSGFSRAHSLFRMLKQTVTTNYHGCNFQPHKCKRKLNARVLGAMQSQGKS